MQKSHIRLVRMVSFAVLIATQIVLSRFCSINAWNLKIGLSFLPIAVAGAAFGPFGGAVVGAVSDFLGAILFPIGPYFPGFTLSCALTGVFFGLALHKGHSGFKLTLAVIADQIGLSLLLNSLWISLLYGSPYVPLLLTRLAQCAVMIPVEMLVIPLVLRALRAGGKLVHAA